MPCNTCSGHGKIISSPCKSCSGSGVESKKTSEEIRIPTGMSEDFALRVPGKGHAPPADGSGNNFSGPPGDLMILVRVAASNVFEKKGRDLVTNVSVPFHKLILGGVIEVPTIDGPMQVQLKPNTSNDASLIISGKGIPAATSQRGRYLSAGDLQVQFKVTLPR